MKKFIKTSRIEFAFLFLSIILFAGYSALAQQIPISDLVLYSGNGGIGTTLPASGGYATMVGSSISISGGSVGGKTLVQTTGNATINSNIYSDGKVILTNSNVVGGKITAANSASLSGIILFFGGILYRR